MTVEPFVHPLNYSFLEATEENLANAVDDAWIEHDRLGRERAALIERMKPLRIRLAELRGRAVQPARGKRTKRQQLVAVCPRCGDAIPESGEAA